MSILAIRSHVLSPITTRLRHVKLNTNVLLPKIVTCIVSNITNCMTSDILTIILVLRGIVKQLHFKLEQTYVS